MSTPVNDNVYQSPKHKLLASLSHTRRGYNVIGAFVTL